MWLTSIFYLGGHMEKVIIGKIVNTHGIKGELKVKASTDFIDERFARGSHVFLHFQKEDLEFEITSMRMHKGHVLITIDNMKDINLVEKYKGCQLFALKDEDLLNEGEYYISNLIGCTVYDQGKDIGVVKEVQLFDHHDVLVVEGKQRVLIPYVDAFVEDEDIENKRIDVHLIEGFYNED